MAVVGVCVTCRRAIEDEPDVLNLLGIPRIFCTPECREEVDSWSLERYEAAVDAAHGEHRQRESEKEVYATGGVDDIPY